MDVSNYFPIDFNRIPNTRSVTSSISTGESSTHDGGAIFDKDRRVVVATSGNYNNGKNLKVTKIGSNPDSISGSTRLIENVIPFNTHGSYPLYDGSKWCTSLSLKAAQTIDLAELILITLTQKISRNFLGFLLGALMNFHLPFSTSVVFTHLEAAISFGVSMFL